MLQRGDERQAQRLLGLRELGRVASLECGSTCASGIGSSHVTSGSVFSVLSGVPTSVSSIGRARRWRPLSMSMQTFVAIRYSQDFSAERPSKRSMLRHARSIVSCTASSASKDEPSIR